jgi:hypothetical protein
MRILLGLLAAVALACAIGACAAIAGLGPYTVADCQQDDSCDGSVNAAHPDATAPTPEGSTGDDDTGTGPADDGGVEAGCAAGLLSCGSGCTDPSATTNCGACENACEGDAALCASGDAGTYGCVGSCPANAPTDCNGTCTDTTSDPKNCSGCGVSFACEPGQTCVNSVCTSPGGPGDGADSGIPCPDGGCPLSAPSGFSCPFGHCNGTTSECTTPGGCLCSNDNQCKSGKCVKVTRENDVSCGSNCTGSGGRDGFNCELASPGIPSLGVGGTYSCPSNSGFKSTTLACDPTHTNCYCTADSQCPSGKCVPSSNNGNCSGCTGTGTPDYRGCQATTVIGFCPIYIGCPLNTICQYPTCYCTNDIACASGHCIPSSHNGNCANCTGTGTDDGNGCMPAPSSVACVGTGGTTCTTTLMPPPVINSTKTACLCVADSDCSSGKCVNKDSQCTGMCTGTGGADSEDCQTAASVANAWSCSIGNCSNVSSPSGTCTAAGVPCWCTSDSQCPSGAQCGTWSGCASSGCTGSGSGNPFNCVSDRDGP